MKSIRSIDTEYNGYLFRSRLEARWAVFFDALNIRYEYEKEGYELPNGERYLPDFWLPDNEIWVEIKGEMPDNQYLWKMRAFRDSGDRAVVLAVGQPNENPAKLYAWDTCDSGGGSCDYDCVFIIDAKHGNLKFHVEDSRVNRDRTIFATGFFEFSLEVEHMSNIEISSAVKNAMKRAKRKRFEF